MFSKRLAPPTVASEIYVEGVEAFARYAQLSDTTSNLARPTPLPGSPCGMWPSHFVFLSAAH
jgi:hypothetical protein